MELSVKNISKSFGADNVLSNVDFEIKGGEICALLGENGAGKSTLMNIISGVLPADSGEIYIDGKKVSFSSPADSLNAGIAFIHQELNLVNDLTVYENMFLPNFPKKGIFLDKKAMIAKTRELFRKLEIDINPEALVSELDASYKQMVEISKALLTEASIIIMDEPTSSLTQSETERIFEIMRNLKKHGIGMIFISHKLREVTAVCDRFTILRNGKKVKDGNIDGITVQTLASDMIGHEFEIKNHTSYRKNNENEIFRLENLSDRKNFRNISLTLHSGEILGITGLLGDGRSELCETVFGIHGKRYTGKIILDGNEIHPSTPVEALETGLAYLPKNRKENAIITDMSVFDNGTAATFKNFTHFGLFNKAAQTKAFNRYVNRLGIKTPDSEKLITTLSGGNQQKVVLAKWLLSEPKVLILDNPTQGVDIGSKEEIYSIIESLASSGISVILLSSEVQEILRLCDRSLVMYHGAIAGEVKGEEMNEKNIMFLAMGAGKGEKTNE